MRMRKLTQGQSVVTFAPPEVKTSITQLLGKSDKDQLNISNVISWLLEQTCLHIDRYYPIWLSKGLSHTRRRLEYDSAVSASGGDLEMMIHQASLVERLMEETKEREARTLEELYLDRSDSLESLPDTIRLASDSIAQMLVKEHNSVNNRNLMRDAAVNEEQEREIEFEVEAEREVQRPPKMKAIVPAVHEDVRHLIMHGKIPPWATSSSFCKAYDVFLGTSAKKLLLPQDEISASLLMTGEFTKAVQLPPKGTTDDVLRPVRWVLTSTKSKSMFLLSQYEANELLPKIQESDVVSLHIYAPRVTKQMNSFYNLDVFRVGGSSHAYPQPPSKDLTSLHLFAGALYFDCHLHYRQLCTFLGVAGGGKPIKEGSQVESDGFVRPEHREGDDWAMTRFSQNPLTLVKEILGMRRKGENCASTHMGRIISGRVMRTEDFE